MVVLLQEKTLNPLDLDPTRTGLLRRQFTSDMELRFNKLSHAINEYVNKRDSLSLNAFQFTSLPSKLKAYQDWLLDQVNKGILLVDNKKKPWLSKYIDSAYKLAITRTYAQYAKGLSVAAAQAFAASFSNPVSQQMLTLMYTRAFELLKGITASMSATMSRIMADSLVHGLGARESAKMLMQSLNIAKNRAMTIARTELINAYANGQLDGYAALGITKIGVKVEHLTAGDKRVCPKCAALNGRIYETIAEARGVIPVHPNCRCSYIPYVDIKQLLDKPKAKAKAK
jgi:SPP1 gp7 family putative phage head morphogenesis protein